MLLLALSVSRAGEPLHALPRALDIHPRLGCQVLRLQVVEAQIVLPARDQKGDEGSSDGKDEEEPRAAQCSAPPQDEPCPAVQP